MNKYARMAVGMSLFVTVWYGLQAWFVQSAVRASSPLAFNAERYLLASLLLGGFCFIKRIPLTRRALQGGALLGTVFTVAVAADTQGIALGSAGRVVFLGSLYVAFLPLCALLFRRPNVRAAAVIGSLVVLLGGGLLLYTPDGTFASDFFGILRALAFGVYLLLLSRYAHEDWRVLSLVSAVVVAGLSIVLAVVTDQARFSLSVDVLAPVILSALMGTILCAAVTLWSGRFLSPALMGMISFLESPFTVIWGILLGREVLSINSLAAFAIISVGAVLVLGANAIRLPALRLTARPARTVVPQS